MSDRTFNQQNSWDETEDEVMRRLERAKSDNQSWWGTILGMVLGLTGLALLFAEG